MKTFKNSHLCLCFVVLFVLLFSSVSYAQGTTSINISSDAIGVGGTTSVTVQSSTAGKMTVKYTASLLELVDCSAEGYAADGNTIEFEATEATITFMGISEGTASIIVSAENCAGSSATLSVGGEGSTEAPGEGGETSTSEETPAVISEATVGNVMGTVNDDGGFDINGVKYVVSERFSESQILDGFEKHVIKIGTHTFNELTNGSIILVYLKPADNTAGDGVFYVYDEAAGTVVPFNYVGSKKDFVLIGSTGEVFSTALVPTTMTVDSGTYDVYTVEGSEFYYFYGTDKNGTQNWFSYDPVNNTVSRADMVLLTLAETQEYHITDSSNNEPQTSDIESEDTEEASYTGIENYQQKLAKFRIIVSILIVICVILIFVIANLIFSKKGEDEDPFAGEPVEKPANRIRSIISKKDKEDSFEESEESDYDFDEPDSDLDDNVEENENDFLIDFNDL